MSLSRMGQRGMATSLSLGCRVRPPAGRAGRGDGTITNFTMQLKESFAGDREIGEGPRTSGATPARNPGLREALTSRRVAASGGHQPQEQDDPQDQPQPDDLALEVDVPRPGCAPGAGGTGSGWRCCRAATIVAPAPCRCTGPRSPAPRRKFAGPRGRGAAASPSGPGRRRGRRRGRRAADSRPARTTRPCCRTRRPAARIAATDGRTPARSTGRRSDQHDQLLRQLGDVVEAPARAATAACDDPTHARGHPVRQERQHAQAAREEEPEVEQVPVRDVADLVAEDRRHLDGRHRLDQGIRQQHVAKSRQDPRDAGVEHASSRCPRRARPRTGSRPDRPRVEAAAQGAIRQRSGWARRTG